MTHGKDIAWKQIGFVGGAFVVGALLGVFVAAPMIEKMQKKKETSKLTEKKKSVLKKTA